MSDDYIAIVENDLDQYQKDIDYIVNQIKVGLKHKYTLRYINETTIEYTLTSIPDDDIFSTLCKIVQSNTNYRTLISKKLSTDKLNFNVQIQGLRKLNYQLSQFSQFTIIMTVSDKT